MHLEGPLIIRVKPFMLHLPHETRSGPLTSCKVAIARALAKQPQILLLDEA